MVLENFNVKVYNNCVWIFTFKIIKMNVIAIGVSKKKKREEAKRKRETRRAGALPGGGDGGRTRHRQI